PSGGGGALQRAQPVDEDVEPDGAQHHERQARVPRARHVQEREDLGGPGHPGDAEADREDRPREERDDAPLHREPPITWRTRSTVSAPQIMKVSVAATDRAESRLSPQTPCPLVQPLPSRVPKPTRSPAATS